MLGSVPQTKLADIVGFETAEAPLKLRITTTYLEMTDSPQFQAVAASGKQELHLLRVKIPCPELNRFLYVAVGYRWWWLSRLSWDYARWLTYLNRPDLETWVAYISGTPAGYFELERQEGGDVELVQFGLLPQFIGTGRGGQFLTAAIARAWQMGAKRVWLHTSTLDHPRALANYQARGFRIFRTEDKEVELPEDAHQPWPGANINDAVATGLGVQRRLLTRPACDGLIRQNDLR